MDSVTGRAYPTYIVLLGFGNFISLFVQVKAGALPPAARRRPRPPRRASRARTHTPARPRSDLLLRIHNNKINTNYSLIYIILIYYGKVSFKSVQQFLRESGTNDDLKL